MTQLAEQPRWGAQLAADGRCRWRVWAPLAQCARLVLITDDERHELPLGPESHGFFAGEAAHIHEGQRYAFRLDDGSDRPDPASQWQPDGVHAPSAVLRPESFAWTDAIWPGVPREDLVIYELHVGTFTPEGTFDAIIPRLPSLRELGVTAIELMPVGQFPGRRNWGYDGVSWFAVQNSYGGPRGFQRLVDACHAAGLGVILDVIYNHLGPEGNYLAEFGPYFNDQYRTPWGRAINFDDRGCDAVREFVLENVRQWIRDYHVDGLRLDAVHAIRDSSPRHILADIQHAAQQEAQRLDRPVHVIAESNLNDPRLLDPPERGGYGLDAQWSDDFHHCVHTLLTGERDGYYADFDRPEDQLVKALNQTFVYDGEYSVFRGRRHGARADHLAGDRFVVSIQTHDQVGNRPRGDRLSTLVTPAQLRLAATLLLVSPHLPLLFMGEEYGETRPFPFFCDFGDANLIEAVRRGRREEFAAFAWQGEIPDAQDEATFRSAILSWSWDTPQRAGLRQLYTDLLDLRRRLPALRDFQTRTARRLPGSGSKGLLHLRRGTGKETLDAYFNLDATAVRLPDDVPAMCECLVRTEATRYGGKQANEPLGKELLPHEAALFVVHSSPASLPGRNESLGS